jgi:sulfur carrier protein
MNITVNGEKKKLSQKCNVLDLLDTLELQQAFVAVAINNSCVRRSHYKETFIEENDKVEILAPMAGG